MSNQDLTVLIVDDVDENIILIRRFLQMEGYSVCSAQDGRRASGVLDSEEIDMVILDINMPVVDGITFLKNMRQNPLYNDIPVIMLTALDDQSTAMECLRIGACGYVTKPFSLKALKQQIENCLSHRIKPTTKDAQSESL